MRPHEARQGMKPTRPTSSSTSAVFAASVAWLALAVPSPASAQPVRSDPGLMRFEVTSKIVRSRVGFTQGFEMRDGVLYESTGNIGGTTQLNTITLDGKVTTLADKGRGVFGEGLTILDDEVFQL